LKQNKVAAYEQSASQITLCVPDAIYNELKMENAEEIEKLSMYLWLLMPSCHWWGFFRGPNIKTCLQTKKRGSQTGT
jgi:hypothetical protein